MHRGMVARIVQNRRVTAEDREEEEADNDRIQAQIEEQWEEEVDNDRIMEEEHVGLETGPEDPEGLHEQEIGEQMTEVTSEDVRRS